MTPCLRPEELVDLTDGTLAPERRAHADQCAACRARVSAVAEALSLAGEDAVPEPPAHFWATVNAGVAARLDQADRRPWRRWVRWPVLVPAAAAAALLLAVAIGTETPAPSSPTPGPNERGQAAVMPGPERTDDADDAALRLIGDLTNGLPDGGWEPLDVGRLPELGTAAALLTSDEQDALAALLRSALDRPKS
ncbi:MAG: hypothetical protein R2745_03925 [Vicinamibacterales bacterium]